MQYDSSTVLQASTTETSTGQSTGITVTLDDIYLSQAKVVVTAIDHTTTDETYVMDLEVYDGTAWWKVGGCSISGAQGTGVYYIPASGKTAKQLAVNGAITQARLNWTLGGTSPSITFVGFLTKI